MTDVYYINCNPHQYLDNFVINFLVYQAITSSPLEDSYESFKLIFI